METRVSKSILSDGPSPGEQLAEIERRLNKQTQHTPGPWHTTGGLVYAQTNPGGRKLQICDAWRDVGAAKAQANARLIAACPTMLAALQEMEVEARRLNKAAGETVFNPAALELAQMAIAKAEGRRE